jgi:pimeloyl-ACP methyl ester carboxylesterase
VGRSLFKSILSFGASRLRRYRIASALNTASPSLYWNSAKLQATLEPVRADVNQHNLSHLLTLFAKISEMDIEPILSQIKAPVTIVAGDRDPLVPTAQALCIHRALPTSTLVMLPNAGHMFFVESTQRYQQLLMNWSLDPASVSN